MRKTATMRAWKTACYQKTCLHQIHMLSDLKARLSRIFRALVQNRVTGQEIREWLAIWIDGQKG
jgi:hypothetical protein